jgi:hypothetical protein
MKATPDQLRALARLLADRAPAYGDRAQVARGVGLGAVPLTGDPVRVWEDLVSAASAAGDLPLLLRLAARARPADLALRDLAAAATDGVLAVPVVEPLWRHWPAVSIAAALVLVLGVVALGADAIRAPAGAAPEPGFDPLTGVVGLDGEPAALGATSPGPDALSGAETAVGTAAEPVDPAVAPPVTAAVDPGAMPAASLSNLAAPGADTAPAEPARPEPVLAPTSSRSRCVGRRGETVGYAYAGERSPGRRGDVWLVRQGVYVRADHPRRDNGWSARARVVCTLPVGSRVALERPPIAVDGGSYWVPVVAGSISP